MGTSRQSWRDNSYPERAAAGLEPDPALKWGVVGITMSQFDGDWGPGGSPLWTKRKKKVLVAAKSSFLPGARLAVMFS